MEAHVTREQLDELEAGLKPVVARILDEPVADTTVSVSLSHVPDDPDGGAVMVFCIKVRGHDISPEEEVKVAKVLIDPSYGTVVKTKATLPV